MSDRSFVLMSAVSNKHLNPLGLLEERSLVVRRAMRFDSALVEEEGKLGRGKNGVSSPPFVAILKLFSFPVRFFLLFLLAFLHRFSIRCLMGAVLVQIVIKEHEE